MPEINSGAYPGIVLMNSHANFNCISRKVNSCYFFPEMDEGDDDTSEKRLERILIVDDEKFNIDALNFIIRSCFKNIGRDPDTLPEMLDFASDGQEAVDKVREINNTEKRYGIIFTDYSMPRKDGYEAALEIR